METDYLFVSKYNSQCEDDQFSFCDGPNNCTILQDILSQPNIHSYAPQTIETTKNLNLCHDSLLKQDCFSSENKTDIQNFMMEESEFNGFNVKSNYEEPYQSTQNECDSDNNFKFYCNKMNNDDLLQINEQSQEKLLFENINHPWFQTSNEMKLETLQSENEQYLQQYHVSNINKNIDESPYSTDYQTLLLHGEIPIRFRNGNSQMNGNSMIYDKSRNEDTYINSFDNLITSDISFMNSSHSSSTIFQDIPQQTILLDDMCANEFMKGDLLAPFKPVEKVVETIHFIHVDFSAVKEISQLKNNCSSEQNAIESMNEITVNLVMKYQRQMDAQRRYFQSKRDLRNNFQQKDTIDRWSKTNKRAFSILNKLNRSKGKDLFIYKIMRKTPDSSWTAARGISNNLLQVLEMDRREVVQFVMRNNCLPLVSNVKQSERLQSSIDQITHHIKLLGKDNQRNERLQSETVVLQTHVIRKIFPLNEQLGDVALDINDYLVVDVFTPLKEKSSHSKPTNFRLENSLQYSVSSKLIVDRYYKEYLEQDIQLLQIQRILNKRNHKYN